MFESLEKSEVKQETIQDIALKVVEEQMRTLQAERDTKERTVFFLGSKSVGKSTVINKFFEREESNTRPTWALEYSYGRRSGQNQHLQKEVLNVWELGSLAHTKELIAMPINCHGVMNFAVVLMLDLSQPQTIWQDFEACYEGLMHACRQKMSFKELKELKQQTTMRLKKELNEEAFNDLLPFPMVIVGGKYDVFQNFDSDLKTHVCQALRSIAQLLGSAVLFYTNKIPKLAKTLRDTVSHLGFGSPSNPFRSHVTDVDEPLSIWFGTDHWNLINEGSTEALSLEQIGMRLKAAIPQKQEDKSKRPETVNPAKDPGFKESIIDEMCAQKEQELKSLLREIQLRGQFESVTD